MLSYWNTLHLLECYHSLITWYRFRRISLIKDTFDWHQIMGKEVWHAPLSFHAYTICDINGSFVQNVKVGPCNNSLHTSVFTEFDLLLLHDGSKSHMSKTSTSPDSLKVQSSACQLSGCSLEPSRFGISGTSELGSSRINGWKKKCLKMNWRILH